MTATFPGSVLAIFAHPDDAELWAGGTLAHHAAHAPVTVAVPSHSAERDSEAAAGTKALGALLHQAQLLDPAEIHRLLIDLCPNVVVTHPISDVHPDHRRISEAVLAALPDAVISTGHPQRLYTCDTYNSLTLDGPVRADTIVDTTATFSTKMQALRQHASQPIETHFGPMAEHLGRLWGARIGTTYAEAFTALPILGRLPAATQL
ncbi:PIG-L deacetylase family protein [Kitasatospora sp. MBT63]|uniref:PIG-L deacetylase family protein n=1 Tax=Kitasatospora sp. MBT63 TaxID=1444768 RepID=UPI000539F037|nr:PIG-L deacetylase family protein [Kitasatospora sp. MBT63]